jgi:hypothetical protein
MLWQTSLESSRCCANVAAGPTSEFGSNLSTAGCTRFVRGGNFEYNNASCAKITGRGVAHAEKLARRHGADVAGSIAAGDWCLMTSGDAEESIWLGRAVARLDWDGKPAKKRVEEGHVTIAGTRFDKEDWMVNVQWYVRLDDTEADYKLEMDDGPRLQNSRTLLLAGFECEQIGGSSERSGQRGGNRGNTQTARAVAAGLNILSSEDVEKRLALARVWRVPPTVVASALSKMHGD